MSFEPTIAGSTEPSSANVHATRRFHTLTVARAAMSRPTHHSESKNDHTNASTSHGADAPASPSGKERDGVSERPSPPTSFAVSERAISQADGDA